MKTKPKSSSQRRRHATSSEMNRRTNLIKRVKPFGYVIRRRNGELVRDGARINLYDHRGKAIIDAKQFCRAGDYSIVSLVAEQEVCHLLSTITGVIEALRATIRA